MDVDLKVDELCDVRLPMEYPAPQDGFLYFSSTPQGSSTVRKNVANSRDGSSTVGSWREPTSRDGFFGTIGVFDFKTPIVGVNRLCDIAVNQAAAKTTSINETQLATPTAISPSNLNKTIRVLVKNIIRNAKSDINLVMTTLTLEPNRHADARFQVDAVDVERGIAKLASCSPDWAKKALPDFGNAVHLIPDSRRCGTGDSNWIKKYLAKSTAERQQTVFASACDSLQRTLNMQTAFYAECEMIEMVYSVPGLFNRNTNMMEEVRTGPRLRPPHYACATTACLLHNTTVACNVFVVVLFLGYAYSIIVLD